MPCQIRWVDMDAYQHVNNTGFLRYLEEGRLRMLGVGGFSSGDVASGGAASGGAASGDLAVGGAGADSWAGASGGPSSGDTAVGGWDSRALVIASVEIAYRRPLVFRAEPVVVTSAVTRVGRSSFDIGQRIADPEGGGGEVTVYAVATSTMVAVERDSGLSRPLLESEREWLGRFAETVG